jgi:hypothetical protein
VAIGRYVLTADTSVAAGTAAAPVAGEPETGGQAGYGSAATTSGPLWPASYRKNQVIVLDTASALYTALSANLRAYVPGTDDRGGAALSN